MNGRFAEEIRASSPRLLQGKGILSHALGACLRIVAAEVRRRIPGGFVGAKVRLVTSAATISPHFQTCSKAYPFREQTAEYAENKRWNRTFSTRPRSSNSEGANWLSMAATAAISFSDSSAYSPYSAVELIRLRLLWPQNFLSDFVSVGF